MRRALWRRVPEAGLRQVIERTLASGACSDPLLRRAPGAAGDDLLSGLRRVGLPIGNLTSQFWSNCLLDGLDRIVVRQLGCAAYVRYVDDMVLFAADKPTLWRWRHEIAQFLAGRLRLRIHAHPAQPVPTRQGLPWLGFVVYPQHMRLKRRKVVEATRRLRRLHGQWCEGSATARGFDAVVQGWISHVRQADSWGLRRHVLARLEIGRRRVGRAARAASTRGVAAGGRAKSCSGSASPRCGGSG